MRAYIASQANYIKTHIIIIIMASASFALLPPNPNIFIRRSETSNIINPSLTTYHFPQTHHRHNLHAYAYAYACKAASSNSIITEFDLYELLGIDSSSDQAAIKTAYRSLQKRCHPDVAGPTGHDMAIILNEAYALLSDPVSRFAYDKEQAKSVELQGYTGMPLYSVWQGTETEERAVFVDEVKCVGCLKCALFADKTFGIESVYGRARVVAQWADSENRIQESIDVCPVNCISMVERSELAALEFLMSKQPRERVRVGGSNTGGNRVFDVFSEVKVFHKRLDESMQRKSHLDTKYSALQRDARISAMQAIKSISNWLYWKPPGSDSTSDLTVTGAKKSSDPEINKLRDAAEARRSNAMLKTRGTTRLLPRTTSKDEYWIPSKPVSRLETINESSAQPIMSHSRSFEAEQNLSNKRYAKKDIKHRNPFVSGIPIGLFVIAASVVRLHEAGTTIGGLEEHIGGSAALQVVNSSWLQVTLAGATWYFVGLVVMHIVEGLARKSKM